MPLQVLASAGALAALKDGGGEPLASAHKVHLPSTACDAGSASLPTRSSSLDDAATGIDWFGPQRTPCQPRSRTPGEVIHAMRRAGSH